MEDATVASTRLLPSTAPLVSGIIRPRLMAAFRALSSELLRWRVNGIFLSSVTPRYQMVSFVRTW